MRQAARDVIRKYELYGESDSSKGKRSPQVLPYLSEQAVCLGESGGVATCLPTEAVRYFCSTM